MERMVTLRIHLDSVPADNAGLLIAPVVTGSDASPSRDRSGGKTCGIPVCLAGRGDVRVYATSILHASAAASGHAHRRILQSDYAAADLPPPWLGT